MMSTRMMLVFACLLGFATACGGDDSGDDTSGDDGDDVVGDDATGDDSTGDDSTGDDSTPACDDLAGVWELDGTCGDDTCTISQVGCGITEVDCTSGAHSTSGTIEDDNFSYDGVSGAGIPATCTGTLTGDTIAGSCVTAAGTCAFAGDRQ